MLARSLATLGLGIALAVSAPVISFAQTKPQAAASVEVKKPVKKKVTKAKPATRKVAKAKPSAKKPVEVAEEKKPRGLFAALFGRPAESNTKAAAAKSVKPQVKKRPMREPAAPMPGLEPLTPIEPVALTPRTSEVVAKGNNGELRSETVAGGGFMASIFGAEDQMLPETRALDSIQKQRDLKKSFRVKPQFEPQVVEFSGYPRGTIVIDTSSHFLYLVESFGTARRYGIAVGKDGLKFKGNVKVGDKQEWPRWIPTLEMQAREPKKYGQYKDGMPGGGANPLGARAIYLYEGRKDTHLRIHGTIAPQSIGTDSSNGCFRMVNEHVIDLYRRVPVGTNVVVL
ncbi:MAG TPA: L,D-transpeptidase [Mesorhizobium sp.]|jgi:lipoprotein-anchoring transpeptidase ErfK/SrfK